MSQESCIIQIKPDKAGRQSDGRLSFGCHGHGCM